MHIFWDKWVSKKLKKPKVYRHEPFAVMKIGRNRIKMVERDIKLIIRHISFETAMARLVSCFVYKMTMRKYYCV